MEHKKVLNSSHYQYLYSQVTNMCKRVAGRNWTIVLTVDHKDNCRSLLENSRNWPMYIFRCVTFRYYYMVLDPKSNPWISRIIWETVRVIKPIWLQEYATLVGPIRLHKYHHMVCDLTIIGHGYLGSAWKPHDIWQSFNIIFYLIFLFKSGLTMIRPHFVHSIISDLIMISRWCLCFIFSSHLIVSYYDQYNNRFQLVSPCYPASL